MVGQTCTGVVQQGGQSVLLLTGILSGNGDVTITTVKILGLVSIATREQGNLSEILLLSLVVLSIEERIKYDIWYIENWTMGLDLLIILKTIFGGMMNSEKIVK